MSAYTYHDDLKTKKMLEQSMALIATALNRQRSNKPWSLYEIDDAVALLAAYKERK